MGKRTGKRTRKKMEKRRTRRMKATTMSRTGVERPEKEDRNIIMPTASPRTDRPSKMARSKTGIRKTNLNIRN